MSPEPSIFSCTSPDWLKPEMSASPLPWMCTPRNSGMVIWMTCFCGPRTFRCRSSSTIRSVSPSTSVRSAAAMARSVFTVQENFPARTTMFSGAMSSIRVNPETDRDSLTRSSARAGAAARSSSGTRRSMRIPPLRPRRQGISSLGGTAQVPGHTLEEGVQGPQRPLQPGDAVGQEGPRIASAPPEQLRHRLHPALELRRTELGVELEPEGAPHPETLRRVDGGPEQRSAWSRLEGVPVPVHDVEGLW